MKIKLDRLRTLKAECEALVAQNAFSFATDTRLTRLGVLAKKTIEREAGEALRGINTRRNELYQQVVKDNPNADQQAISSIYLADSRSKEIMDLQAEIWAEETDFEFKPIPIGIDEVRKENFEKSVTVEYYGYSHHINPNMCLQGLITEGFAEVSELKETIE
ncbi:hypothetical protein MUK70_11800 [Dyadobacter chenwenxiniae]|uniref:Uncharacterized protein n=1 Tax=Dyadobacter chenwenxiniae TaxID=2906456 RepID=A0A9X1PEV7_9BACT|nr:hypothetical protein [Dyadobacter chenwenxiniae]MCF0059925.1 hypothetical protein [Dyadobacter chenwenxiniae]UON85664.1 hypothetical protein MUK70_11800 [Dyadobacter chenwenxiniae]